MPRKTHRLVGGAKKHRDADICAMFSERARPVDIARKHAISRQAVYQILTKISGHGITGPKPIVGITQASVMLQCAHKTVVNLALKLDLPCENNVWRFSIEDIAKMRLEAQQACGNCGTAFKRYTTKARRFCNRTECQSVRAHLCYQEKKNAK